MTFSRQSFTLSPAKKCGVFIAVFAVLSTLILAANPGFYSHDEWQRFDFLQMHGMRDALKGASVVKQGITFAAPVRPIGFLQQIALARWMTSAPLIPHLFDVLLHTLVTLVFFKVLTLCDFRLRTALLASLLFCLSPLTMLATGWTGASFDQWHALFMLGCVGYAVVVIRYGATPFRLATVASLSTAAILSKETAIVLPLAIAGCVTGFSIVRGERIQWRRATAAFCAATLPTVAYLAYRLPALKRSLVAAPGPYTPSWDNVVQHVLGYLEYQFIPRLDEIVSIIFVVPTWLYLALLIHLVLIVVLAVVAHWKVALAYVFSYFLFLLPVLTIPQSGSHYLYASGFSLSLALAWLITRPQQTARVKIAKVFALLCACVLTYHAFYLQAEIYRVGVCQNNFLTSLDTLMADRADSNQPVEAIQWTAGTPTTVASGAIFGRDQYRQVHFADTASSAKLSDGKVRMDGQCRIR